MALITGTPLGSVTNMESLTLEGAPYIYIQDYTATPLNNPDGQSYYWGLSGTTLYPAYNLGCVLDVSLSENLTVNQVRCDNMGDKDTVQKRNYIELTFTMQNFFPLSIMTKILSGSTVTLTGKVEKMGIGKINNNQYWMCYLPKVYDEAVGDYVAFHMHKAKFVEAWTINMKSGDPWSVTGLRMRAEFDDTKPAGQEFMTVIRADPSAL